MRIVESLPREFERFRQIGGVLHFAVYEDAGEDEAEALVAISAAIPDLDTDTLKSLGCKRMDNTFEEVAFDHFSEIRERVSSIVDEFVDSARTFNFAP